MPSKKNIALVLSSGGARGNAHIGVIQEFIARGYKITSISGTSMGAVIGGVFAAGKLDEFTQWMSSLHKMDVFSLMDFTLSKQGFVKADRVFNEMKKFIPEIQIEELQIPFVALATDLKKKEAIVFDKGSLFNALRASVAIPAVITPIKSGSQLLVDGGLLAPIPVQFVKRKKGDLLVIVNVNAQVPYIRKKQQKDEKVEGTNGSVNFLKLFKEKISNNSDSNKNDSLGFFDLITNSSNLMLSQISKLIIDLNPPDILVEISREACETYDFYKASEMINLGKQATAESLNKFEKTNV